MHKFYSFNVLVEWSARLAWKRAFGVRRLLAPLSMMHIPLSVSETSVSSSTPTNPNVYDAYTSKIKQKKTRLRKVLG